MKKLQRAFVSRFLIPLEQIIISARRYRSSTRKIFVVASESIEVNGLIIAFSCESFLTFEIVFVQLDRAADAENIPSSEARYGKSLLI